MSFVRETLSALGQKLDPHDFLRIHRTTIVNVRLIKEIPPWFHGHHFSAAAEMARNCG